MIEHADHLDVAAIEQRQDEVPSAERRMHSTIGERGAEARVEPLNTGRQSLGPRRVGEVVESHPLIVDDCGPCSVPGSLTRGQREVLLRVGVGDMAGSSDVHTKLSVVSGSAYQAIGPRFRNVDHLNPVRGVAMRTRLMEEPAPSVGDRRDASRC